MGQTPATDDVVFFSAAGVQLAKGAPLVAGTTYYAGLGGNNMRLLSPQWKWDAALIATITYETSNFPDVPIYAAAASGWCPEPAIATLTIPGGAAGVDMEHIDDIGSQRMRAQIVVGATGGALRGRVHHKD